jgi:hypothetical protein
MAQTWRHFRASETGKCRQSDFSLQALSPVGDLGDIDPDAAAKAIESFDIPPAASTPLMRSRITPTGRPASR